MILEGGVCVVLGSVLLVSYALKPNGDIEDDFRIFRHKRQTDYDKCTLPPYPQHGIWKILKGQGQPGDEVPIGSVITFECDPGYRLPNDMPSVCLGRWSSQIPQCEKLCPPLYPSDTYNLKCIDARGKDVKCSEAAQGTNLEYDCKDYYETPFGFKKTLFCEDGKWDSRPVCQPVCGKKITNNTNELIYGSKPSEKIEYPWVAALYSKTDDSYENICGGSIISQTVVLTAAHCVTNSEGGVLPKENYLVGVGKLYRKYLAPEDTHAQYSQLLDIAVPKKYKGDFGKYAADIAVLVVKKKFKLNKEVQPVCFTNLKNIQLRAGNRGEISAWGLAEGNIPSEVLRSLVIPYKYETVCADELPPEWADGYNLADKMCAGFFNQSTSVCKGDSGAGLAFKYHEDQRYYVHGIVSVGYKVKGECDIQQNSIYTKVASYYDFVNRLLTAYTPEVKDCILPPFPENGRWRTEAGDLKPGDSAPANTVLRVECEENYRISSTEVVECGTAHTMPRCDKLCPELDFPVDTTVMCGDKDWNLIDCSAAIEGTLMLYHCPRKYMTPEGSNFETRTCGKGSWGSPEPECIRILKDCGKKIEDSKMEYPWNVGIYKTGSVEKKYKYICGGSIVSQYAVLTDAQCVTDEHGDLLPKEDFLIAAGKLYSKYEDTRDTHTQIQNLSVILIHPEYKITGKSLYNIALAIVTSPFRFNAFVQPVCLIGIDSFWKPTTGEMVGWRFGNGVSPKKIEALQVEFLNDVSCKISSRFDAELYIFDKKCAGFDNESICLRPEDSGKGLVAKNPEDGRYYLRGIVIHFNDTECLKSFWNIDLFFYRKFIDSAGYIF